VARVEVVYFGAGGEGVDGGTWHMQPRLWGQGPDALALVRANTLASHYFSLGCV
jgi:hypothetical protein